MGGARGQMAWWSSRCACVLCALAPRVPALPAVAHCAGTCLPAAAPFAVRNARCQLTSERRRAARGGGQVKTLNGTTYTYRVKATTTVQELKAMVTKDTAIPAKLQRIIFRGKVRSPAV